MEHVVYERFSPHGVNRHLLSGVVESYREVFATGPWYEWKKCPTCNKYWGKEQAMEVQELGNSHCGVPMVDYWPADAVSADLIHEITPAASCWIATFGGSVIGFTWGYPIELRVLEQKLSIPVIGTFVKMFGRGRKIAYQDEVGVIAPFRNRKIAKGLVIRRFADFLEQGLNVGVVRTREKPEPSVTYAWYRRLGYRVLARYPDGRIVLAHDLNALKESLHG